MREPLAKFWNGCLDAVSIPAQDDHVKTATLDELQSNSDLLKEAGPILVTREGHPSPLPLPDESLSIAARRGLFKKASEKTRRQLDAKGITEEQVDSDIAALFEDDRR